MPVAKRSKPGRPSVKSRKPRQSAAPFLLEIGTEELPASFVDPALQTLEKLTGTFFHDHRLSHGRLRTFGTPRRLAVLVEELSSSQASMTQEIMGPPKSAAFDAEGNPTKAGQGFANSQGVQVQQLQMRETPKGIYVCAVKHHKGQSTPEVLRHNLAAIVQQLSFSKSMYWNDSKLRFARPLRWMVALYGNRSITFELGGIRAGSRTWGHRFLCTPRSGQTRGVEVKSASSYVSVLKRLGVEVDPQERRAHIRSQIDALSQSVKGQIFEDHADELLEQAVFCVEGPKAILGQFNPEFLKLPKEVLMTSMKEHQGYFSLVGRDGALLPKFIAVTNMKLSNMNLIRTGHERVLAARLNDAQYFFHEDRKHKLEDRAKQLGEVIFHQKLGSVYDKTDRVRQLVTRVAEANGCGHLQEACQDAATLAKADLLTGMVGEFPSLQGIMGREYAKHEGKPQEVWRAIGEQYLPRSPEDVLPQTQVGVFLALADRLDTLTAFFYVGMVPSGSEDPFGLRRAAYGLTRIISELKLTLNLVPLMAEAEQLLASKGIKGNRGMSTQESLMDFVLERFRFYGRTTHRLQEDVMEAVLTARVSDTCDLYDLLCRMRALQALTSQPEFHPLIIGFKRANRIVEKEQWTGEHVQTELLDHESEWTLFHAVIEAQKVISERIEKKDYKEALTSLLRLKSPIDGFFVGVMVNASDSEVRANRLSLLRTVAQLFFSFADFSRIQSQGN